MLLLFWLCSVQPQAQETPADSPAPIITISLNGSRDAALSPGTPLLIKVALIYTDPSETNGAPLLLAADQSPWSTNLQLVVTGPNGVRQNWALQPINSPEQTATLDEDHSAELAWWLPPGQTAALPPGWYTAWAIFDAAQVRVPAAWRGAVASVPANLQVQADPALPSEEQRERRQLWLARYSFFSGQGARALDPLDQLLAEYPGNFGALLLKSVFLLELGQLAQASAASEAALLSFNTANPNPQEPPLELLDLQSRIATQAASVLVQSIQRIAQAIRLSWPSQLDHRYQVERSFDLKTWELFAEILSASSAVSSLTTNITGPKSFFRIVAP